MSHHGNGNTNGKQKLKTDLLCVDIILFLLFLTFFVVEDTCGPRRMMHTSICVQASVALVGWRDPSHNSSVIRETCTEVRLADPMRGWCLVGTCREIPVRLFFT